MKGLKSKESHEKEGFAESLECVWKRGANHVFRNFKFFSV